MAIFIPNFEKFCSETPPSQRRERFRGTHGPLDLRGPADWYRVKRSRGHRRDVQGLRAIAVTAVVFFHAGFLLPGGFIGVDVFFVLSGFVIMLGLLRELEETDRIDLRAFMLRRIRRLLPALAVLLVVVLIASTFLAPIGGFDLGNTTSMMASLFNANTYLSLQQEDYFSTSTELNPLLHTWSLSIEEQFYFVFPAAVLFSWWVAKRVGIDRRRTVGAVLVVGSIASLGASVALTSGFVGLSRSFGFGVVRLDQSFAFYSAPTRAWEFAAGALFALVSTSTRWSSRVSTTSRIPAIAGAVVLVACGLLYGDATTFPGLAAIPPVVATLLLLMGGNEGPVGRVLGGRLPQRIGELSYGWYLWHWPVIVFTGALVAFTPLGSPVVLAIAGVASLGLAELSLRLVENPVRFADSVTPQRTIRLAMVCVLLPIVVAAAVGSVRTALVDQDDVEAFELAFDFHRDVQLGCDRSRPAPDDYDVACRFSVDDPVGTAALVGDSNAGHLTDGVIAGMNAAGYDVVVATRSACPFADLTVAFDGRENSACRNFLDDTMERLRTEAVDVVVIGHAFDRYVEDDLSAFGRSFDAVDSTEEGKREVLADGLARTVTDFVEDDIDVFVVHPPPRSSGWDPEACPSFRWSRLNCAGPVDPGDLEAQRVGLAGIHRAAHDAGANVVDIAPVWCDGLQCDPRIGEDRSGYLLRDEWHITVQASQQLAPVFEALVSESPSTPPWVLAFDGS